MTQQAVVANHGASVSEIAAKWPARQDSLLPILHAVQNAFGCVDRQAEAHIAKFLNLSRAEVHGVVSFYHDFTPMADLHPCVELCRAEACQARGAEGLVPAAETAAGSRVALKAVYCLGLCSVGPAARIGDALYARLDEAALVKLVQSA